MNTHKANPSLQEIKDTDLAIHNHLVALADSVTAANSAEVTAKILAVGLAAIHERLGDMWIWDKAISR